MIRHGCNLHIVKATIMKKINQAVYEFMDKRLLGVYTNPHHVEIILDEDNAISVSSNWPDAPVQEALFFIELQFNSETIEEFTTAFGITLVRHLDAITPAVLLELYRQGKAVLFSAIDKPPNWYALHFRKKHNVLSVKGANNKEEEVHALLETPNEFKIYTQQHFRLAGKS